jgi:hypothetical protein
MKRSVKYLFPSGLVIFFIVGLSSCFKTQDPINFKTGIFPDTVVNLTGINSEYDDYNVDLNTLNNIIPLVFSSNRGSSGGQFDLVQAGLAYSFNQINGDFILQFQMTSDPFLLNLLAKANTQGDDFGPYRLYSAVDGYEYLVLSSENDEGNLDFRYTRNLPYFGSSVPEVTGPFPATKLNSASNEAYFCFDTDQDSAYYTSDKGGDFDIYVLGKGKTSTVGEWLNSEYETPSAVNELNSTDNDKCPYIYRKVLVFASDRPDGYGGYDLYYSVFKNGKWGTPVNFGPFVNSSSDEYRPVLSGDEDFSNMFLIFSSNRPGGLGGFDLYFAGIGINQ